MRSINQLVFDDFVSGTATLNTDPKWNDLLGSFDALALQAVADQVSGSTVTITVQIQHAADDRNFGNKNAAAEINAQPIDNTKTWTYVGSDGGGIPNLGFVRLAITLGGGTPVAHVRLWATGRSKE